MPKPKVHFLVCSNQRPPGHPRGSCAEHNAGETANVFGQMLQDSQKFDTVKVSMTSCLGPCSLGPVVVAYPDNAWYGQVDADKAKKIWESHVDEGKPASSLEIPEGSF